MRRAWIFLITIFLFCGSSGIVQADSPIYRDGAHKLINVMMNEYCDPNNDITISNVKHLGTSEERGVKYDSYSMDFGTTGHTVNIRLLCNLNNGSVMKAKVFYDPQDNEASDYSNIAVSMIEYCLGLSESEVDALWGANLVAIRNDLYTGHVWCNSLGTELQVVAIQPNANLIVYTFIAV